MGRRARRLHRGRLARETSSDPGIPISALCRAGDRDPAVSTRGVGPKAAPALFPGHRVSGSPPLHLSPRPAPRQRVAKNFAEARELIRIFTRPLADRMLEAVAGISLIDRRRIEICRAMISRPRLLLLDEPSAGMTREETSRLM